MALFGCPGGERAIGEPCNDHGDCGSTLQCASNVCVPRCQRAPECGDGFACDASGICRPAEGQAGNVCTSEVECVAGLSCQLESNDIGDDGKLRGSCVTENAGRPAGAECTSDGQCRNGTCALGHCTDLCSETRDCGAGSLCTGIPRIEASGALYNGCLQAFGSLRWGIPIQGPAADVLLPIPETARSVSVLFSVEDQNQKVGALSLTAPDGQQLIDAQFTYFTNPHVRHRAEFGQSVLAMPSTPTTPLQPGAYALRVSSLRPRIDIDGVLRDKLGTATPTMTAVVKLDASVILDLHFHFLNLDDHPCAQAFGGKLDATTAQALPSFQDDFIDPLRTVFARGGVALGNMTYADLRDHPDLDGLDVGNATSLLELGTHSVGVNVFFVRTLTPVGLQAFGPNPGPAGLAGTRQSGIVIGVDALCYRSWEQLSRLAARELARYMGLYNNVELDPTHLDPIADSDETSSNLMFYSERGGVFLSPGQAYVLSRSAVLR